MMNKIILSLSILFLLNACSTKDNVEISDYPIVTTVSELSEYYNFRIDESGKHEKTSTTKYFDGAVELDYEYEYLDLDKYDQLYYSILIERARSVLEAKKSYNIGKGAFSLVGNSFDQGIEEITTLDLPGDAAYYGLRTVDEEPNGMFFIVRDGQCIFTMVVSGIYTPDHSLLTDLIFPKIKNLSSFDIVD